jgi:hypothetical protein
MSKTQDKQRAILIILLEKLGVVSIVMWHEFMMTPPPEGKEIKVLTTLGGTKWFCCIIKSRGIIKA